MEWTNIKHIVFEFHTYIMWSIYIYAGHVSSSVVWSAFSVCLSKAFYQLICLFGLLVLRNVATYTKLMMLYNLGTYIQLCDI